MDFYETINYGQAGFMGNTRRPRKEREYQQRRSEILKTALLLFSEKGFHGASMQEIAEKSEYAVGTLYNLFSNKDEIYRTLIVETADKFHSDLISALEVPGDEITRLRGCLDTKVRVFLENLEQVRIYFAETQGASFHIKPGLDRELKSRYEDYLARLAELFQSGARRGRFIKRDPYLLALAFDSLSTAFLVAHMECPGKHPFDTETIMDIFLNGASVIRGARR